MKVVCTNSEACEKNPDGKKAWELIEESGLRSFKMNGISLSPKHVNFIVNQQFTSSNMIENNNEMNYFVRNDLFHNYFYSNFV